MPLAAGLGAPQAVLSQKFHVQTNVFSTDCRALPSQQTSSKNGQPVEHRRSSSVSSDHQPRSRSAPPFRPSATAGNSHSHLSSNQFMQECGGGRGHSHANVCAPSPSTFEPLNLKFPWTANQDSNHLAEFGSSASFGATPGNTSLRTNVTAVSTILELSRAPSSASLQSSSSRSHCRDDDDDEDDDDGEKSDRGDLFSEVDGYTEDEEQPGSSSQNIIGANEEKMLTNVAVHAKVDASVAGEAEVKKDLKETAKPTANGSAPPTTQGDQKWRPHMFGLHFLWRTFSTQLRAAAAASPSAPSILESADAHSPHSGSASLKVGPAQGVGASTGNASVIEVSTVLNRHREEEQVERIGGVQQSCVSVASGGNRALASCPSCAGLAPGEVQLAPPAFSSSTANGPMQDSQGKIIHSRETYSAFLHHATVLELRTVSLMAMLCDMAYGIPKIKPMDLFRDYRLRMVTSSLERKAAKAKAAAEAAAAAAAASFNDKGSTGSTGGSAKGKTLFPGSAYALATAAANYIAAQSRGILPAPMPGPSVAAPKALPSPVAAPPPASAAALEGSSMVVATEGAQSEVGAAADVVPTLAATALAAAVTTGGEAKAEEKLSPVTKEASGSSKTREKGGAEELPVCPCEWFVCDDIATHTRYFVIQGSDSLASWQANISFDPVQFEGPALGVLVHRGIYEAAKALYVELLPLVKQHIRRHGEVNARLRFTGHSLGGSLAALISVMLHIREKIPLSTVEPVYTFGSPSVMCGGDLLLERLGLPQDHILSVAMHRDIVPRAFACDYPDHVAEVLRRMSGSFRDHPCLLRQRLLYAPMGMMMVLQPHSRQAPPHPLLPEGAGLYRIRHPHHADMKVSAGAEEVLEGGAAADCSSEGGCSTSSGNSHISRRAMELRAAQRALLNHPHPLEILSDPGAYGFEGAISRDHDPRNYLKTVNYVLRQEMKRWRRVQREQRKALWWPLVSGEAAVTVVSEDGSRRGGGRRGMGPAGSRVGELKRSPSLKQIQSVAATKALGEDSIEGTYAGGGLKRGVGAATTLSARGERGKRYSNLMASQHVHLGALAIALTYPLGIAADLGSFFTWI